MHAYQSCYLEPGVNLTVIQILLRQPLSYLIDKFPSFDSQTPRWCELYEEIKPIVVFQAQ